MKLICVSCEIGANPSRKEKIIILKIVPHTFIVGERNQT